MKVKFRKLLQQLAVGIAAGIGAHVMAAVTMISAEQIAHFVGHVFAVILFWLVH